MELKELFGYFILGMIFSLVVAVFLVVFGTPNKEKIDFEDNTEELKNYNSKHHYED
jgi:uncharacterized membrane protein